MTRPDWKALAARGGAAIRRPLFKGQRERDFAWYSIGASMPGTSLSADRAGAAPGPTSPPSPDGSTVTGSLAAPSTGSLFRSQMQNVTGVDIPLLKILLVSAVVMGLSHTVAREKIFEPLRARCGGMSTWRGYLLSCPYCASHWLAFVLVPLTGAYGIRLAVQWPVITPLLDWFLSSILVTVVAAVLRVGFYFIDEEGRLAKTRKQVTQREADQEEHPLQ